MIINLKNSMPPIMPTVHNPFTELGMKPVEI